LQQLRSIRFLDRIYIQRVSNTMWKEHKYHCYVVINSNLKDKMGRRFTKLNNHVP